MKRIIINMLLPIIILCLLLVAGDACRKENEEAKSPPAAASPAQELSTTTLDIAGETFTIELAYRQADRMRGLMFREHLPAGRGMIFIFPHTLQRTFHMNNCRVDIDVLFLNDDGTIVKHHNMKAPSPGTPSRNYPSVSPCKYALELPAGTIQRLNLRVGQRIELNDRIGNILPDPDY